MSDFRKSPRLPEQFHRLSVINEKVSAHLRMKTALPLAGRPAVGGSEPRPVHVGGRPAQISDSTPEPGGLCQPFQLSDNRIYAATLDEFTLVMCYGAECASAITPPMGGY